MSKPVNESNLSKPEKELVKALRESVFKFSSFQCLDQLTDFNDCRETGLKKNKKLRSIKDEEVRNYELTKGCFDEYEGYINCVRGVINNHINQKEINAYFIGPRKLSFNREQFKELLIKDFKLI